MPLRHASPSQWCDNGLADHRDFQHVVEFGVQDVARFGEVDVAQAEPLADEVCDKLLGLGMIEEAFDLVSQVFGIGQTNPTRKRGIVVSVASLARLEVPIP